VGKKGFKNEKMVIGIDAANLRQGGGVTHLIELLRAAEPEKYEIQKVVVWGSKKLLYSIENRPWIEKIYDIALDKGFLSRIFWQRFELSKKAKNAECDVLFIPGGSYTGTYRPYVTMCRNLQVFETYETNREGLSILWFKLKLLKFVQSRTFRESSGLIYISEYAHDYLRQYYPILLKNTTDRLIAHGTLPVQTSITHQTSKLPNQLHLLYVSNVKQYKHHWNLIDAVGQLRREGFDLMLDLVGGGDSSALRRMFKAIKRNIDQGDFVLYHGHLSHSETLKRYLLADLFVYPSSCENLPNILVEAMTAGLPIASSDRGPMPEVLKDAGLYFNPESVTSIKNCLRYMIENPNLRQRLGAKAKQYSQTYSWKKCADETFSFLRSVYEKNIS